MGKIYARERSNVGKGAGRPRFEIVAVNALDLKVYHSHIRKAELEKIAADLGAEVIYLPRGEGAEKEEHGKNRRRGRHSEEE